MGYEVTSSCSRRIDLLRPGGEDGSRGEKKKDSACMSGEKSEFPNGFQRLIWRSEMRHLGGRAFRMRVSCLQAIERCGGGEQGGGVRSGKDKS